MISAKELDTLSKQLDRALTVGKLLWGILVAVFGLGLWIASIQFSLMDLREDVSGLKATEAKNAEWRMDVSGKLGKIEANVETLVRRASPLP